MDIGILDHILALVIIVLIPLVGTRNHQRLIRRTAAGEDGARLGSYRTAIIQQWGLVAGLLVVWFVAGRTTSELGLGMQVSMKMWIGWSAMIVVAFLIFVQTIVVVNSDKQMESLRRQMAPLSAMLPHDDRESRTFAALSITAGICEELLYRGFLMAYLISLFGTWPGAVLSSVAFGIAHSYQGRIGIAKTAAVGACMAGLFLLTGSLWAPMILHAIIDLNAGHMARRASDAGSVTAT